MVGESLPPSEKRAGGGRTGRRMEGSRGPREAGVQNVRAAGGQECVAPWDLIDCFLL